MPMGVMAAQDITLEADTMITCNFITCHLLAWSLFLERDYTDDWK
jgi:hypothetical protein